MGSLPGELQMPPEFINISGSRLFHPVKMRLYSDILFSRYPFSGLVDRNILD
jgi:hypothetical protein